MEIVSFLETDRQRWLAKHLTESTRGDIKLASQYLVTEAIKRAFSLQRSGAADTVVRDDFLLVREACDHEMIRRAQSAGLKDFKIWLPVEEVYVDTPGPNWPVSGATVLVEFPVPKPEPTPAAVAR